MNQPGNTASLATWADWLAIDVLDEHIGQMVGSCARWATALRDGAPARWLTILGPSGVGKTHCAQRLFDWASPRFSWLRTAYCPAVVYWPDFVQKLRSGDAFRIRDDMKFWPVLFLDDVGAERDPSGFAAEELNTLLGCRAGRWTILTANLTLNRIEQIDGRLASRMVRDSNIVSHCNTEDYAVRKRV